MIERKGKGKDKDKLLYKKDGEAIKRQSATQLMNLHQYSAPQIKKIIQNSKKLNDKLFLYHLQAYLASRDAVIDFQALRERNPLAALQLAVERVWGKAAFLENNQSLPGQVNVLISILTGALASPQQVDVSPDIVDVSPSLEPSKSSD